MSEFEGKSDHDLLVVAVTELGHIKNHTKDLAIEAKKHNGRLSACEASIQTLITDSKREKLPKRVGALETWQIRMGVIIALIGTGWPLLIYEVRRFFLEQFGFIP